MDGRDGPQGPPVYILPVSPSQLKGEHLVPNRADKSPGHDLVRRVRRAELTAVGLVGGEGTSPIGIAWGVGEG